MKQLTCKNLSIGYDGNSIFENINFEIDKGSYVCVIGANGKGKTTLLKTLLNIIPAISGEIIWNKVKGGRFSYLPQLSLYQKDFPATVSEIVLSGCLNTNILKAFYTKKDKLKAIEMMKKMEIEDLSKKSFKELSGGQQKRVLLARALAASKDVLFLDEPTASLDSKTTKEMYEIIRKLNEDNITIIMITHEIDTAIKDATHILSFSDTFSIKSKKEYLESRN